MGGVNYIQPGALTGFGCALQEGAGLQRICLTAWYEGVAALVDETVSHATVCVPPKRAGSRKEVIKTRVTVLC